MDEKENNVEVGDAEVLPTPLSERSGSGIDDGQQTPTVQIVQFAKGDPENPYNWGMGKKLFVALTAAALTLDSTISSAITSNAVDYIMAEFGVAGSSSSGSGRIQGFLPTTVYLIGYTFGPLIFGPLSETYGRKVVVLWTFNVFILFTMACALAPNWPALLVFRMVCGTCASVPLTVIGGVYADIFASPQTRGRAMVAFMSMTTYGPLGGPIISGFVAPHGWRWTLWIALIIAGCSWVPLVFMPETFGPVLLQRRARALRKATGNPNIAAPLDLETRSTRDVVVVALFRPLRMLLFEPLVYLNCLYIALLYAIFYLFFEAYPIIFGGLYGFSKGQCGLALIPIGTGAALTAPILIYYDTVFERCRARGAAWAQREELRRLPIACLGGPFCVVSLFWLAWTARADTPWITPCMAGLFFGFGYLLIFTALANYQVDAYEIYAASAMAASCFSRSIVGATLPLAGQPLYAALGDGWATSVVGFLSLAMVPIPFGLIHYGPRIRLRSKLCQDLLRRAELKREAEVEQEV